MAARIRTTFTVMRSASTWPPSKSQLTTERLTHPSLRTMPNQTTATVMASVVSCASHAYEREDGTAISQIVRSRIVPVAPISSSSKSHIPRVRKTISSPRSKTARTRRRSARENQRATRISAFFQQDDKFMYGDEVTEGYFGDGGRGPSHPEFRRRDRLA
jgi:hypothetical protein